MADHRGKLNLFNRNILGFGPAQHRYLGLRRGTAFETSTLGVRNDQSMGSVARYSKTFENEMLETTEAEDLATSIGRNRRTESVDLGIKQRWSPRPRPAMFSSATLPFRRPRW